MKANIVDLRYNMKKVIKALDKNESVSVLYHGKIKGILVPAKQQEEVTISKHPFFGMNSSETSKSVLDELDELRNGRLNDF